MVNNSSDKFKYDSCVSRGQCSINPKTASLQEILVLYLKITAYYVLKTNILHNDKNIQNLIFDTISTMTSYSDFSENDFNRLNSRFMNILPEILSGYEQCCDEADEQPEYMKTDFKYTADIINSIRQEEREFLSRMRETSQDIINFYKIIFIVIKSFCSNIVENRDYGEIYTKACPIHEIPLEEPKKKQCC